MAATEIGIGVVGTGFGVRVQIPVWRSLPGVRVSAVCSRSSERAKKIAERFDIPHALDDPAELSSLAQVDLVSVTTRPDLHHADVMAAVGAGKHVLCEKPFAMDAAQARDMLNRARARGVAHLVNFEFRRLPARTEMRRLIVDGFLGELRHVYMTGASDFLRATEGRNAAWWFSAAHGGGWLGAACSHDIDALRFLFGEIEEVSARLGTFIDEHAVRDRPEPVRTDVDDSVFLLLRFGGGALGVLASSAAAGASTPGGRLEAYGSEGTLVLDGARLRGARSGEKGLRDLPVPEPSLELGLKDPHYVPFALWAAEVADALRSGRSLRPDFEDGLRNQQIIDAARQSSAERRWISTVSPA